MSGEPNLRAATAAQIAGYNARRAGDFETALAKSEEALQACAGSKQLSASEAEQMRDASVVLRGWDPR